jgi:hypothetical protein
MKTFCGCAVSDDTISKLNKHGVDLFTDNPISKKAKLRIEDGEEIVLSFHDAKSPFLLVLMVDEYELIVRHID